MAKAKTSVFTLTHELSLKDAQAGATIPIGSLIDVGDAQALEIVSVDYCFAGVYQTSSSKFYATVSAACTTNDAQWYVQLMDKNAGDTITPADNNVISSASLLYDSANVVTNDADFFPDDFKGTNGRFVVNDELYVQARSGFTYASNWTVSCTIKIQAKVVKLSTRDWMAISLETVQNE